MIRDAYPDGDTVVTDADLIMNNNERKAAIVKELATRPYLAIWSIARLLGMSVTDFGGCGLPSTAWTVALYGLIAEKMVEEVPDLGFRYRLTAAGRAKLATQIEFQGKDG